MVMYVGQQCDTFYFGTAKPDGGLVTESDWRQFLNEVVAPRFPGFTHYLAHGEYKGVAEDNHILVIVHGNGDETRIREMVDEYKRRFAQETVLQVRSPGWVKFR